VGKEYCKVKLPKKTEEEQNADPQGQRKGQQDDVDSQMKATMNGTKSMSEFELEMIRNIASPSLQEKKTHQNRVPNLCIIQSDNVSNVHHGRLVAAMTSLHLL
jgi:hypothetical protein